MKKKGNECSSSELTSTFAGINLIFTDFKHHARPKPSTKRASYQVDGDEEERWRRGQFTCNEDLFSNQIKLRHGHPVTC